MIPQLRRKLENLKGHRNELKSQMVAIRTTIQEQSSLLIKYEQAREIIRTVGLETQQNLQYHISDIVSLALEGVFTEPYQLKVEFIQRRNKTECDLLFVRDGKEIDPLESSGYGAVDVASFALRVASWSMNRNRNIIVLDEPMRFLSEDYQEKAGEMIKELSNRLGLQFLIVTHEDTLSSYSDSKHFVKIKNKISIL